MNPAATIGRDGLDSSGPIPAEMKKRRFTGNFSLMAGTVITGIFILTALISFVYTPDNPNTPDVGLRLLGFGAPGHLLGTDSLGRDVLSGLMAGARTELLVAGGGTLAGLIIGGLAGLAASSSGKFTSESIMRGADLLLAFPGLVTALVLAATIGPGDLETICALTIFFIPSFARVVRAAALRVLAEDFTLAARLYGRRKWFILGRHVVPNIAPIVVTQFTLHYAAGILIEAGLSYLGVGVTRPDISWGLMLEEAQSTVGIQSTLMIWPGLAIVLAVLGLNLLGDGLRDVFDPKLVGSR